MRPQLVGREIGGVEVGLGWVKDHAVDARVWLVGVVLRVLCERTTLADGEDIAVASMVVEGVGVDVVRWLARGKEEDGTGVCGSVAGFGVAAYGVRGLVNDLCGRLDCEAGPFLHGRAIDILFGVLSELLDLYNRISCQLRGGGRVCQIQAHIKGHP